MSPITRWLIAVPGGAVLGYVDEPDCWSALRKAQRRLGSCCGVAPWQSASEREQDEAMNLSFRLEPTA